MPAAKRSRTGAKKKVRKVANRMYKGFRKRRANPKTPKNRSNMNASIGHGRKQGRKLARKQITKGRPGLKGKAKKKAVNARMKKATRQSYEMDLF